MPLDFNVKRRTLGVAQKAFVAAVVITILNYGSTGDTERHYVVIAFALLAGLSAIRPLSAAVGRLHGAAILLLAALAIYIFLQAMPFAAGDFANGAWKSVNEKVGPVMATISVAPTTTLESIPSLALPFFVFLSALSLFQGDSEALWLWRALAYFGVGYAVFGILQEIFLPQQLFLTDKTHYVGSLTATFVNRNTAGTFFGLALLLNLGLVFSYLRDTRVQGFLRRIMQFEMSWRDKYGLAVLHIVYCLTVAVALVLTQSRGASASSFIGAAVGIILMSGWLLKADASGGVWARNRPLLAPVIGLVLLAVIFETFSGRVAYRIQEEGVDQSRWCTYASTLEAIKDHPLFGSGFGTFRDVFPLYRNVDCVGIFSIWDKAHNSFLEGYLGLGLPFALALLIGYATLTAILIRGMRTRRSLRFAPVMAFAALTLVTLHALVDFSLQIPGLNVFFAAMLAVGVTTALARSRT